MVPDTAESHGSHAKPSKPPSSGKTTSWKSATAHNENSSTADANQERTTCKWLRHPQINTKGTIRDRLQRNRRNSQRHIAIAFILDTLSNSAIEDRTITVMLFGPVRLFSIINLLWYEEKRSHFHSHWKVPIHHCEDPRFATETPKEGKKECRRESRWVIFVVTVGTTPITRYLKRKRAY